MVSKGSSSKNLTGRLSVGLLKFLSWLPLSVAQFFGKLTGRLLYLVNNKQRFLVAANLRAVYPELAPCVQQRMQRQVLQHNAQTIFELGAMWFWPEQKVRKLIHEVHGESLMEDAFAKGHGVILLAPHIGNWEMVGNYLAIHYPATFMYKPPKLRSLDQPMQCSRRRFGADLAPTNLCGVKKVIQALKCSKVTAILPDQDAGENGIHAPFMGVPARTMTLISKLLQKTQAQCLFGVALRLPSGRFVMHFLPADRDRLASKDPLIATTALNQGVEQCVALAPEQYLWCYRRFRGLPLGYPDIYSKANA